MAVTIITQPATISPIYNPLIVTCSSTNVAQPNFKFVFDIEITYPTSITTKRFKLSPRPDGYGMIDVHRVLEAYLSYDYSIAQQSVILNDNSNVNYNVKIYEEYGTPPVVSALMATVANKVAFNGALKQSLGSGGVDVNFIDFDFTDYVIVSGTTNKFLTSSPRTITIDDNQSYSLYMFTNSAWSVLMNAVFIYYNSAGTILSTRNVPMVVGKFARVMCGTRNITINNPSDLTNCAYYTVQIKNASSTAMSEIFRFNIEAQCTKAIEHFRLHWLNELGGFDAFNFNYTFRRKFDIQKGTFDKMLGTMSSGAFSYSPTNVGKTQFNTLTTETIQITSGWITEAESVWLSSLLMSPQVFWEKEQPLADTPTYIPVTIKTTNYQQKTYAVDDKLFALELNMEIANKIIKQRQ